MEIYEHDLNLLYGFERLYKGAEAGVLSIERFPLVAVALLDQTLRYDAELLPVIVSINTKRNIFIAHSCIKRKLSCR